MVKPIDLSYVAARITGSRILVLGAAAVQAGANAFQRIVPKTATVLGVTVIPLDAFDERIDQLWARACGDYLVMAIRNRLYLNWRFFNRPGASYMCLATVRNSDILGYMVFRVADRSGVPTGFVVDYLVENKSLPIFSLLLDKAEDEMIRGGAKLIACVVAPPPYRTMLHRHGFLPAIVGARGTYLTASVHLSDSSLNVFADLPQWFVTMGDGSLEMVL